MNYKYHHKKLFELTYEVIVPSSLHLILNGAPPFLQSLGGITNLELSIVNVHFL